MSARCLPRALRTIPVRIATPTWTPTPRTCPARAKASSPTFQCVRSRHTYTVKEAAKILFKKHPIQMTTATSIIVISGGGIFYGIWLYHSHIIGDYKQFPEPVAVKLRRAIFYTNVQLSPENALKYYKEAVRVAEEVGMDPFSDEVLGIKIQFAFFLEKIQVYRRAIDVLELVRQDCLDWLERRGALEGNEAKRTRVLAKVVGMTTKLGELYANQYVMERDLAEERLVWAVETVLKETKRREREGVKPNEGEWLSSEEMGGAFEALANHYEEKNAHYLAAPLYLQSLTMIPKTHCHAVVLMNNLSASLAQQVPPPEHGMPPVARSELIKSGKSWAQKALEIAETIKPPDRTEECDVGCVVATHNLGELAEMEGDFEEARRKYTAARSLAKAADFRQGVKEANAGLKRLKSKS